MTQYSERLGLSLCPFCGGAARFGVYARGEEEGENDGAEYVECCDCGASTCLVFPCMDSAKQPLRDMWNRRPDDRRPAVRADGMPASANERYLRRLLAARAAMPHTYMDDGEAHGHENGISIDFMREPVADIDAKLRALNVARAIATAAASPPSPPSDPPA